MHALRFATRTSSRRKSLHLASASSAGVRSPSSTAVFLSALATLGASSAQSTSVLRPSAFGSSAMAMSGVSGMRLFVTSAASAMAIALMMPQGVTCSGRGGESEDNDDDDNGNVKALLRIARNALLGDRKDADGQSKSRGDKGGKDSREADDMENVKKLVRDLVDAFNGFGSDVSKAVKGKNAPPEEQGLGDVIRKKINEVMESGAPTQISFGFGMGVCCGFAAKKTAKVALVGVGLAFGSLQVLSYLGYLKLDYAKIEHEVMTSMDIDKNGKVDTDDVQEVWNRVMKVLSYNLPTGSGFVAGALIGARMG